MSMKVNYATFVAMIDEDIAWAMRQPRTLEREHVVACLEFVKTRAAYDLLPYPGRDAAQPDGTEKGPTR